MTKFSFSVLAETQPLKETVRQEVFSILIISHLRPATLLKRRLWHRCFLVNFVKFLRTPFFIEQLWTTASTHRHADSILRLNRNCFARLPILKGFHVSYWSFNSGILIISGIKILQTLLCYVPNLETIQKMTKW